MHAAPSFSALDDVPPDDPPHTSDSGWGSHPARHHYQASVAPHPSFDSVGSLTWSEVRPIIVMGGFIRNDEGCN